MPMASANWGLATVNGKDNRRVRRGRFAPSASSHGVIIETPSSQGVQMPNTLPANFTYQK